MEWAKKTNPKKQKNKCVVVARIAASLLRYSTPYIAPLTKDVDEPSLLHFSCSYRVVVVVLFLFLLLFPVRPFSLVFFLFCWMVYSDWMDRPNQPMVLSKSDRIRLYIRMVGSLRIFSLSMIDVLILFSVNLMSVRRNLYVISFGNSPRFSLTYSQSAFRLSFSWQSALFFSISLFTLHKSLFDYIFLQCHEWRPKMY